MIQYKAKWSRVTTNGWRRNRQKCKSEMDKLSLKWNSLCGVASQPLHHSDEFGAVHIPAVFLPPRPLDAASLIGRSLFFFFFAYLGLLANVYPNHFVVISVSYIFGQSVLIELPFS